MTENTPPTPDLVLHGEGDPALEYRELTILYATETGNAQDVAERLGREARRRRWRARVVDVAEFDQADLIRIPLLVFILSTTGNGAHITSFQPLWSTLLRADLPPDLFSHVQYAVFGLGDSGYARFNWAAKSMDRRMETLGAERLVERGEGDERHYLGIDGAFGPWSQFLFSALDQLEPLPPHIQPLPESYTPPPRARLNFLSKSGAAPPSHPPPIPDAQKGKITKFERMTSEDWWQDVRRVELDFEEPIDYDPGDIAVLYPSNPPAAVDSLLSLLGWSSKADEPLTLQASSSDQPLPPSLSPLSRTPTTLRLLLTHHLSPFSVPRRTFFEFLTHFAQNDLERDRLKEFLTPEGGDDLFEYCTRVKRTAAEALADFKSVRIPLEYVLDVFPEMRPRKFSIASDIQTHPQQIHLCIALVKYKTKLHAPRRGVCSTWLKSLAPGSEISVNLEKGTLPLPSSPDTPLILVGPGTGVAPMRALLERRFRQGSKENTLYFGCRKHAADALYEEEWTKAEQEGALSFRLACSRDQEQKVYVQHLIQRDGKRVHNILFKREGLLYISGSSGQMPKAVRQALAWVVEAIDGVDAETATRRVEDLEREGRLREECW